MQHPYLTIVLSSRNDNFVGGALPRLQICIDSLLEQAERHQLELELVLVDWNPPVDKAPLKDAVVWPKAGSYSTIRVIEVPPALHQPLPFSDKLPFLPHRARNVGIRRARGKFVLVTATDILFSESLIAYLASKQLREDRNYRVTRYDVPDSVIQIKSLAEKLEFCEKNFGHVHELAEEGLFGLPLLHVYASGDFVLLSKDNYFKLHGIPEEREFNGVHFDTVFCYMMYAVDIKEEILLDPHRVYHIDHESLWQHDATWLQKKVQKIPFVRWLLRNQLNWFVGKIIGPPSKLDRLGVPYIDKYGQQILERTLTDIVHKKVPPAYNGESWGLGQYTLPESEIF